MFFRRKKSKPSEPEPFLTDPSNPDSLAEPFFYEIHVRGRLSQEKWTAWFDNLAVTTIKGETTLRGTLTDHAALYGLLARLRDLAVPLLSVKVLDAEAWRRLQKQSRRYDLMTNIMLLMVYLLFLGGLITLTVFASAVIHTALALALLFAVLGGLAYALFIWSAKKAWLYFAYLMWPAAMITFFIYLAVAQIVHPSLAIATLLFLTAGGLIYVIYYLRRRAEKVNGILVDWETIGRDPDQIEINDLKETAKRDMTG